MTTNWLRVSKEKPCPICGKPDSMVVNYYVSIAERVQEWVCPLHSGYPMQKSARHGLREGA